MLFYPRFMFGRRRMNITRALLGFAGLIATIWLAAYFMHIVADGWQRLPIFGTAFLATCVCVTNIIVACEE